MNTVEKKSTFGKTRKILTVAVIIGFCLIGNTAFSQIKITKPTATDSLFVSEFVTIAWESQNLPVSIFYSEDNGTNWKLIAKDVDSNSYRWNVPYISIKNIKIKIETEKQRSLTRIYENSIAHHIETRSCDFSADGKYFLTTGDDGYFRIWDIERKTLFREFQTSNPNAVLFCAKFVNNADSVVFTAGNDVFLWDIKTNTEKKLFGFDDYAFYFDINFDRNLIGACSWEGKIILYSLKTNSIVKEFSGASPKDDYYRCRFSRDGKFFAFVGFDKYVNLYDLPNNALTHYKISADGGNVIWGLDFSFDSQEIGITGLDGYIRCIKSNSMELLAEYKDLHTSSHIRAIRYLNTENDFVSGCLAGDLLWGNFENNSSGKINIFDRINVGYQITDIECYAGKYIAVAGREPRNYGRFTIFRVDYTEAEVAEITTNVFYKYKLSITQLDAPYNQNVYFDLKLTTNCDESQIPFSYIPVKIYLDFPCRFLDVRAGELEEIRYEGLAPLTYTYSYEFADIMNDFLYKIPARTLLGDGNFGRITLEDYYSENEMLVIHTTHLDEGYIRIISECDLDFWRSFVKGMTSTFRIMESNDLVEINLSIASDDGYTLTISDINGKIVLREDYSRAGDFDIYLQKSDLASGLYFVRLASSTDYLNVKKFILTR